MKVPFTMWKHPKMIVLTAVSAFLYALVLVPFKGFQMISGIAEIRPAAVLPPVLGILFGPAGAWGCMIGNTIGDYFGGTLSAGSYFGAVGNFCFAMIAYTLWSKEQTAGAEEEDFKLADMRYLGRYVSVCVLSCSSVAFVIAWGLELLKLSPFAAVGSVILVNNLAATLVLGPFLLKLFHGRASAWNLLWFRIMPKADRSSGLFAPWAARMIWFGAVGGLVVGLFVSHVFYQNPFLEVESATMDPTVIMTTAPFLILFFIGCLFA